MASPVPGLLAFQGNYKRLSIMKYAENVPPVYEIIWMCDVGPDQLNGGQSRFFASTRGTNAEQQKVSHGNGGVVVIWPGWLCSLPHRWGHAP